ncbi:MAG TPA: TetR/AcrR family transcriptional regulator, partial [Deltaproteobacteria bacterium]|nr:TetR/AcrR family transcriptional regulator [Deltaproteobacteria bacterium]
MTLRGRTTKSPREERRERELARRRDDILAAASRAFSEKGFQDTQVAEIANAAEVSLNSVYALFKGKEELYEAVLSTAARTVGSRVRDAVRDIPDPAERLLCIIDALFACFEEHRALMRIYANSTHGLPWRVRQSMGEPAL